MKASAIFLSPAPYNADGGVVVLDASSPSNYFYLLGTSVETGTPPDKYKKLDFLNIIPNEEGDGVLAVCISIRQNKCTDDRTMFIGVGKKDGTPFIDLEKTYVPKQGRIGHVTNSGVEVLIGGVYYTSDKADAEKNGKRYVADANLLCKYYSCQVNEQMVLDAACMVIDAARDAQLESDALAEAAELRNSVIILESYLAASEKETANLMDEVENLKKKDYHLRESRLRMNAIIDSLLEPHKNKPWWSKRIKEIDASTAKEMLI